MKPKQIDDLFGKPPMVLRDMARRTDDVDMKALLRGIAKVTQS